MQEQSKLQKVLDSIEGEVEALSHYAGKSVRCIMKDGDVFEGRCSFGGMILDYYEDDRPFTGIAVRIEGLPIRYMLEIDDIEEIQIAS